MNLNLFGSDDDDQSSRFVVNLKKETYDPLLITFNAITAGPTKKPEIDKDKNKGVKDTGNKDTGNNNTQTINLFTQSMLTTSASVPVDLDAEQKKTQDTSCDYVAFVPTSFDVSIDTVNAFYESKNEFKQTFGKLNVKEAVSSVFMQWTMFEQYVKFVKKNAHKRELALIEQSYKEAIIKFKPLIDGMNNVLNLTVLATNLDANPASKPTADLTQRFVILYTTPTDHTLDFLPLSYEFVQRPFHGVITQKALTYFYNYFQYLCMKSTGVIDCSVGRIPNYLPALTSNIGTGILGTPVHYIDVGANPAIYAKPSYNIELIPNFLMGIMNTKGSLLPNRATLSRQDKFKVIRDNTHLYTFKSTTEYSMNYETLLNRLYYKPPCYLTPIATVTKDAMTAIAAASKAAAVAAAVAAAAAAGRPVVPVVTPFYIFLRDAIAAPACDKTKSHSIICAVAIATREFIFNETAIIGAVAANNSTAISANLFTTINFRVNRNNHLQNVKTAISECFTALPIAGTTILANQLNPLIGAACAAGDAVYSAAKRAITTVVMADANATSDVGMTAIRDAMNSEIDNLNNFAAFMYDNNTLLSLMKYSDQAQMVNVDFDPNNPNILPENLLPNANYLNTLYANQNKGNPQQKTQTQLEKQKFDEIDDDVLYTICGPVYFDYTWIFKQNPELIKHILGEDKKTSETNEWTDRTDLLTGNNHYVNYGQKDPNLPKMRFDINPSRNLLPSNTTNEYDPRYRPSDSKKKTYKEIYVSPSDAKSELDNAPANVAAACAFTATIAAIPVFGQWDTDNQAAAGTIPNPLNNLADRARAIYNWTTPGYYLYEITYTVTNEAYQLAQLAIRAGQPPPPNATPPQLINRFTQLMRPPTQENGIQDYTEPNLPTAYPPPLMFITPPMRDPTNTFMIHAWIPDLSSENSPSFSKFMTTEQNGTRVLKRDVYMDYMYKMMQLIFNTATMNSKNVANNTANSNASSNASSNANRNCIKIMAVGYNIVDQTLKAVDQNLKAITDPADKKFVGDAFFYALRDYSMLNESAANNVHVTVYYDTVNQSEIKQRYDEYVSQRESRLQRISGSASIDTTLKLKIQTVDDFFTLKYPDTLQNTDLLHFVDYCSTPRAFIGNCGEWPENIEEVMDQAVTNADPTQPLLQCLNAALNPIAQLYNDRGISDKITQISQNLADWNAAAPKTLVTNHDALKTAYLNYATDNVVYNAFNNVPARANGTVQPRNINVSWWQGNDRVNANSLPRNAYMSSFDEHVLVLHNLLNNTNAAAVAAGAEESRWVGAATPRFATPSPLNNNVTENYGPFINYDVVANDPRRGATFENAVYAYTQAKKILTLLTKMGSDNIQIMKDEQDLVKMALDAINAYNETVKMSWSMDAKFTAAVAEGAFIPNSSALHNPFMCTKLLDPKEWKFVDFKDIAVREINGVKQLPLQSQLKRIVDNTIRKSVSISSAVADSGIMISKQPNIDTLKKNIGIILENMFHKDDIMKYAGKNMVFNNYSWPDQLLYYKLRNNPRTQQLTATAETTATPPNFAELMGLLPQSGTCVGFPLFVVQLMFYLFDGNVADMTGIDKARLSCALDGNMFKTNAQIIWEQMMKNMKTHEQNFTMTHLLNRLGSTTDEQVYSYFAYFDGSVPALSLVSIVARTTAEVAAAAQSAAQAAAAPAVDSVTTTTARRRVETATFAVTAARTALAEAAAAAAAAAASTATEAARARDAAAAETTATDARTEAITTRGEAAVAAAALAAAAKAEARRARDAAVEAATTPAAKRAIRVAAAAAASTATEAVRAARNTAAAAAEVVVNAATEARRAARVAAAAASTAAAAATAAELQKQQELQTANDDLGPATAEFDAANAALTASVAVDAAAAATAAAAAAAAANAAAAPQVLIHALTAALAGVGSADILIDVVNSATNPTLKTTNYETLTLLNTPANQTMYNDPQYTAGNPLPPIVRPYNSIGSIEKIAEIFNDVEMHGAAGEATPVPGWRTALQTIKANYTPKTITPGWNSRIGWNAAIQTESTMLYVNVNAKLANGSVKNIKLDLTSSLKPGDKILITDETAGPTIKKKQMWLVTKQPFVNQTFSQVVNVPVSFMKLRLTNLRTILPGDDDNIPNTAPLTVTLQRFTQENLD
jgi:hypothetical protein